MQRPPLSQPLSFRQLRRFAAPTLTAALPAAPAPRSFGTYYYLDGGRYEGEWVDDRIHGKGKSVYANGNVYDGEWTDGRINGARIRPHAARLCRPRQRRRCWGYVYRTLF